ncbi:hypothetical protein BKA56DRAFT_602290 [Ilyonectria sp. MPI-CAGE-AT-0026]|nr:hypothetical protein BKA56DRAFT_602290 [Ilyonectria sp. MPI-CAGE-AT-0026]
MGSTHDRIITWLETATTAIHKPPHTIPETVASRQQSKQAQKRPREVEASFPSPPASQRESAASNSRFYSSHHVDMPPETPKKRRLDGNTEADETSVINLDDATPRAPTYSRSQSSIASSTTPSLASNEESLASGQSSPSKIFSALSLKPEGIDLKTLDLDDPNISHPLSELLADMEKIARGKHVVPSGFKADIEQRAQTIRSFTAFEPGVFMLDGGHPNLTEPRMQGSQETTNDNGLDCSLHDILRIVNDAKECHGLDYDEAGWNSLVHSPLLHLIHHGHRSRGGQLDGFSPCTSARITPVYRIKNISGKQVDYVLFLDPEQDESLEGASQAILNLRKQIPENSINHTSYAPLLRRPISISIETKRSGGHQTKAKLQMSIWQSAQWKLLADLAGPYLSELPFIPGVVIEGHEWKFVATTNLQGKTTLWTDQTFGTTKTALGTFQIIAGVNRLRRWSRDVFWPWYKSRALQPGLATG